MNTTVGYVLVSPTRTVGYARCPDCPPNRRCESPPYPQCRLSCVHDPRALALHPECQAYDKATAEWNRKHPQEWFHTGGTRLGPLHYFKDCITLLKRGPRSPEARVVALDPGIAQDFGLPLCKECQAKMAPFESQLPALVGERAE